MSRASVPTSIKKQHSVRYVFKVWANQKGNRVVLKPFFLILQAGNNGRLLLSSGNKTGLKRSAFSLIKTLIELPTNYLLTSLSPAKEYSPKTQKYSWIIKQGSSQSQTLMKSTDTWKTWKRQIRKNGISSWNFLENNFEQNDFWQNLC